MACTVNWLVPASSSQFECVYVWPWLQWIGRLGLYTLLHSFGCYFIFVMDSDEFANPQMWLVSCAHPPNSHGHSHQTLKSYRPITHYTCCGIPKIQSGFCWKGKQGRECPDKKVWAVTRSGRICFTMSSCEKAPVGSPSPPPPLPHLPSTFPYFLFTTTYSHLNFLHWLPFSTLIP